jgi:hypothetical protein
MLIAFKPGTNRAITCEGGRRPQTRDLVVVFADRACGGGGARSGDRAQQKWGLCNNFGEDSPGLTPRRSPYGLALSESTTGAASA